MCVIMLVFSGRRTGEIYPGEPSPGKAKLWSLSEIRRILLTKCVCFCLNNILSDVWEDPLEKGMAACYSILVHGESHGQRSRVGYSA